MHSIYEKECSLIFPFIFTCWSRHSIVLHDHSDGSRSAPYGGATGERAHSSFPGSRCSWDFFFFFWLCSPRLAQKLWCLAPAVTGYCIHPHIQNSTSRHKGRDSDAVSEGTPSSCSFCAFSQQLGQLRQHPYKLLSIFRSVSPSGRQKTHSYSNECSYNAMTVNT